jgi:hypothetical protein
MIDSEIITYIRNEIKTYVNLVLLGQAGNTTKDSEDIVNMYGGHPTMTKRPVMHPYGFVSRAPAETLSVTCRAGDHPVSRIVLGHRDADRPEVSNPGEVIIYNAYGRQIRLNALSTQIGSDSADEPLALGNKLNTFLDQLLTKLKTFTVICTAPGNASIPNPAVVADLTAFQLANTQNPLKPLLSDTNFTEKGSLI